MSTQTIYDHRTKYPTLSQVSEILKYFLARESQRVPSINPQLSFKEQHSRL